MESVHADVGIAHPPRVRRGRGRAASAARDHGHSRGWIHRCVGAGAMAGNDEGAARDDSAMLQSGCGDGGDGVKKQEVRSATVVRPLLVGWLGVARKKFLGQSSKRIANKLANLFGDIVLGISVQISRKYRELATCSPSMHGGVRGVCECAVCEFHSFLLVTLMLNQCV